MDRINPSTFSGARIYLTDFDPKVIRFASDHQAYRQAIERCLKATLLTKNFVVCAASHLASPFTFEIMKANPVLLRNRLILPALRTDKQGIADYVEADITDPDLRREMRSFYDENVDATVEWELQDNSAWFKRVMYDSLSRADSVLRLALGDLPESKVSSLLGTLVPLSAPSREDIELASNNWPAVAQAVLMKYVNLAYHRSGARVVNSLSHLPGWNFIDYTFGDLTEGRTSLTDVQVFLKLFFEYAYEIVAGHSVATELLDMLSFEDLLVLRGPIDNSVFREKYDKLIENCVKATQAADQMPDGIEADLVSSTVLMKKVAAATGEVVNRELPAFAKKRLASTRQGEGLHKSLLSVGLGTLGLIPVVGTPATVAGIGLAGRSALTDVSALWETRDQGDAHKNLLLAKERSLRQLVERIEISDRSAFLDTLHLIRDAIGITM